MTRKGDLFCAMDDSYKSKITLRDDKTIKLKEWELWRCLQMKVKKSINDVYYIPKLKHYLLSVGQIMENNYKLMFEDTKYMIFYKNKGHKHATTIPITRNRLLSVKFGEKNSNFANVPIDDKSWVWHLRYGI